MNTTMQLALVIAAVCLCLADAAPDGRLGRTKQQRPTRGFKNVEMMTARGFGKRARTERVNSPRRRFNPKGPLMVATDFGKRSGNDDLNEEEEIIRVLRGTFKPGSKILIARDYGKRDQGQGGNDREEVMRVLRGNFKPGSKILIARDFGKREQVQGGNDREEESRKMRGTFKPSSKILIGRDYGKRDEGGNDKVYGMDNFWDNLEASQDKDVQEINDDKVESIPLDWFVSEMLNNPDFARSVVRKFIDINQDGMLSADELLRTVV